VASSNSKKAPGLQVPSQRPGTDRSAYDLGKQMLGGIIVVTALMNDA